jgi:hypothetical protein
MCCVVCSACISGTEIGRDRDKWSHTLSSCWRVSLNEGRDDLPGCTEGSLAWPCVVLDEVQLEGQVFEPIVQLEVLPKSCSSVYSSSRHLLFGPYVQLVGAFIAIRLLLLLLLQHGLRNYEVRKGVPTNDWRKINNEWKRSFHVHNTKYPHWLLSHPIATLTPTFNTINTTTCHWINKVATWQHM